MKRIGLALFLLSLVMMAANPELPEMKKMLAQFARVELRVDTSKLAPGDQQALAKLLEAARLMDEIFLGQMWSGNKATRAKLALDHSEVGKARLALFDLYKSPWSSLDGQKAFVPGVPERKPLGAGFYPEDMTKEEFTAWDAKLPAGERQLAEGFFSVIRRNPDKSLKIVPFHLEYEAELGKAAKLLREAADLTPNPSLKKFLRLRAEAFLSDDYYASDVAWMDLDAPIDVTIGPYETYNDELFGYKASFEAYVTLRDEEETTKLDFFAQHLQEIENHLPIPAEFRNPKIGASAPIRVVNEILATGDGAHGVRTAAFNLPNDERVVREKGSKRVMLKNVQEAKFNAILKPIADRVLPEAARKDLNFDSFFTHILAHELSHGIGPHQIQRPGGATTPRQELKELYSPIEEAKADITSLFLLQYLFDQPSGRLKGGPDAERRLYTTFLASAFRTLRFGLHEAHGRGMALQFNYLTDKGAFRVRPDGTFEVNPGKIKDAVRDLTHDLLMVEAKGDYAGAKRMLDELAVVRPAMQKAFDHLGDLPTDIAPVR